ncbi:MAG TPA: hypothetical protein VEM58_12850, partial [Streptosporangiaceae bacterium]|nr:hypothetical protein [Streptosporangiaceae bacterium]
MTALTTAVRLPRADVRGYLAAGGYIVLGLIDMLVFSGLFATGHHGDAVFALSLPGSGIQVPSVHVPAAPAALALGALTLAIGPLRVLVDLPRRAKRLATAVALVGSLFALLCWTDASNAVGSMNLVDLLQGTVFAA